MSVTVGRHRMLMIALSALLLWPCFSGISRGGEETASDFSLMDAIGGRASPKIADMPEGTFIEFHLMKPGQFVPGKVGQKLYLFSCGKGWFQIREDIPEIDIVAGGGLRHFHLADVLPPDRVFDRLGLRDVKLYRERIHFAKVDDPKFLRELGVKDARRDDLVTAHHYKGWVWRIRVARKGFVENIEVEAEAWYQPHPDLGEALAAAGIAVSPSKVGRTLGVRFLARVREPRHLVQLGLIGLREGSEVIVEAAAETEWKIRSASIGFPLSVRVAGAQLDKLGIEDMRLLRIPDGVKVEGRVVSPKLARKAELPETERDEPVSIGFEKGTKKVLISAGEKSVERDLEGLLATGGK